MVLGPPIPTFLVSLRPQGVIALVLMSVSLHYDVSEELLEAVALRDEAPRHGGLDAPVGNVAKIFGL